MKKLQWIIVYHFKWIHLALKFFDFHAWVKKCHISLSEKLPKWHFSNSVAFSEVESSLLFLSNFCMEKVSLKWDMNTEFNFQPFDRCANYHGGSASYNFKRGARNLALTCSRWSNSAKPRSGHPQLQHRQHLHYGILGCHATKGGIQNYRFFAKNHLTIFLQIVSSL